MIVDLLVSGSQPFEGDLSMVFDDETVKVGFLVDEPIRIKSDKFTKKEILEKLGPGSGFEKVPLVILTRVFGRIELDFESREIQKLEEVLALRSEPSMFVDQQITR